MSDAYSVNFIQQSLIIIPVSHFICTAAKEVIIQILFVLYQAKPNDCKKFAHIAQQEREKEMKGRSHLRFQTM